MKWSFATVGLIAAGLVGVVIILLFQNLTVKNEEDYYLLKEILEASMTDSIDLAYYRDTGELKIVQEKLVENFTRRFAESSSILNTQNYSLEFFNIMEKPPKASVRITTDIGEYTIFGNHLEAQSYGVTNSLDGILEIDELPEDIVKKDECYMTKLYSSIPYVKITSTEYRLGNGNGAVLKKPKESGNWIPVDVRYNGIVMNKDDIEEYRKNFEDWYVYQETGWETIDPDISDYIATNLKIERLEILEDKDLPTIYWQGTFKCDKGKVFNTISGGTTVGEQCIIGVKYEVEWYNQDCDNK